ncbi:hypothetical protein C7E17_14145, partial [Stenotrophomonas maltophilia]
AASELTGHSRAAQWMLLQQMVDEARGQVAADSPGRQHRPDRPRAPVPAHRRGRLRTDRAFARRAMDAAATNGRRSTRPGGCRLAWTAAPTRSPACPCSCASARPPPN